MYAFSSYPPIHGLQYTILIELSGKETISSLIPILPFLTFINAFKHPHSFICPHDD